MWSVASRECQLSAAILQETNADKPHDAFRGQSRSANMVPFHILAIISY